MRSYRAGEPTEEFCRVCKIDREHTVIAVDEAGQPMRVRCDYCGSQHNSRGVAPPPEREGSESPSPGPAPRPSRAPGGKERAPLPLVSDRERREEPVMVQTPEPVDLELLLRRVIREETGLTAAVPAEKWRDGTLVLRPGTAGLQEKSWPIETFFHKVVMIRNRLRTLEQQVNGMDIPEAAKVKLQAYITGCYGSLSSFNVLFADQDDNF